VRKIEIASDGGTRLIQGLGDESIMAFTDFGVESLM